LGICVYSTGLMENVIVKRRLEQNAAMWSDNPDYDLIASFWTDDFTVRRALGQNVNGKEDSRKMIAGASTVVFQRIPATVTLSERFPLAFEDGMFCGYTKGTNIVVLSGRYAAQWVKRENVWFIRSELFCALDGDSEMFQALP
jgi:ketosteroid isomerase-like protein